MRIKPGLPHSLLYLLTGAFLLHQSLLELLDCCEGGFSISGLIGSFKEGGFYRERVIEIVEL